MSHYTVLVIGEEPEELLAPYDENIKVEEYEVEEVSDEEKMRFLEYYAEKESVKNTKKGQSHVNINISLDDFPKMYRKYGTDWNGNRWRVNFEGVWKEYSTYNPDSKWDWYQLGGRWAGMLLIKDDPLRCTRYKDKHPNFSWGWSEDDKADVLESGLWVDQARKEDVDWEGMAKHHILKANERYDEYEKLAEEPIEDRFRQERGKWWDDDKYPNDRHPSSPQKDYADKETMLLDMWRVKCAQNAGVIGIFEADSIPEREKYTTSAANFATYAVLGKEFGWEEPGPMGWWGMSGASDEEKEEFEQSFWEKYIEPLDGNTLLSVYDCHI